MVETGMPQELLTRFTGNMLRFESQPLKQFVSICFYEEQVLKVSIQDK